MVPEVTEETPIETITTMRMKMIVLLRQEEIEGNLTIRKDRVGEIEVEEEEEEGDMEIERIIIIIDKVVVGIEEILGTIGVGEIIIIIGEIITIEETEEGIKIGILIEETITIMTNKEVTEDNMTIITEMEEGVTTITTMKQIIPLPSLLNPLQPQHQSPQ